MAHHAHAPLPELTLRGMLLGALITFVFTASNVYLGLKVGLTFASAIPAAVISMAVLRFASGANILENNIVQTQASSAGSISAVISSPMSGSTLSVEPAKVSPSPSALSMLALSLSNK